MAEQQIYQVLVELQQHLRLFFSSRYHWPSASILVSGIDRWVIAMWCHWLLSLHGLYQSAPIAVWAKCHKNSLSYVVFVFVFAILDFSPLQLRALFAFEFIPLVRVLSIHETPFQTLNVSIFQIRFSEWWPFSDGNFCSIFKHIALSWGSLCVARSSQTWVNSKHTLEFFVLHLWVADHFLQGSSQMGQWIGLFSRLFRWSIVSFQYLFWMIYIHPI